jgi:Tol biopolymer transport system component
MRNLVWLVLITLGLLLLDCNKSTEPEPPGWERNPNLTLLTRAHFPPDDRCWECSFPVWSPDGNKIYYIESRAEWWEPSLGHKGNIWVIDPDGENAEMIKEGDYLYLSISPDGRSLVTMIRNYKHSYPGGTLVLIDISTMEQDTIPIPDTGAFVLGAEFTPQGDKIVYYAVFGYQSPTPEAYYSFNFKDSTTSLLFEEDWSKFGGFDLYGDEITTVNKIRKLDGSGEKDLMIAGVWPEFSPDGERLLSVGGFGSAYRIGGNVMHLVDAKTGTLITDLDVQAYELSTVAFPYWSPDGKKIVFASKPWGGDNQRADFHLWILNEVEETNQ